jgi:hypothetical protein
MILGLFGMSYNSTSSSTSTTTATIPTTEDETSTTRIRSMYQEVVTTPPYRDDVDENDPGNTNHDNNDEVDDEERDTDNNRHQPLPVSYDDDEHDMEISMHITHRSKNSFGSVNSSIIMSRLEDDELDSDRHHIVASDQQNIPCIVSSSSNLPTIVIHEHEMIQYVHILGYKVSKRCLGILSAAFCGLYGGSVMAPMKFSTADTKGTHYLLSFAIGSLIVNISLWIFRYLYNVTQYQSLYEAYVQLPSFHLRKMWLVGGTSGIIWSIGNFFSLISVFYLGQGVGYPLVQTSILISGLWGLFYFKEIQGTERITKWLLSSLITVFGILLLSYEHHSK